MENSNSGFREIEHTADWELEVWAPSLEELFIQAAKGMSALAGLRLESGPHVERSLLLHAPDSESLLVAFLSELLYITEQTGIGFTGFHLEITNHQLSAKLSGAPLQSLDKEIKAVTYHQLLVSQSEHGYKTRLVFDV